MIAINFLILQEAAASVKADAVFNKAFWQIIAGAGLGASFYVLVNSYKYIITRSFDPEYGNTYLCRLVIGFISGVILAFVAKPFISEGTPMAQLGPGVIALIGGFSAEAVEQVLNRLVEIILSAVRGDASAPAKAQAEADVRNTKNDLSKDVAGLLQHTDDPAKLRESIKGMLDKLR